MKKSLYKVLLEVVNQDQEEKKEEIQEVKEEKLEKIHEEEEQIEKEEISEPEEKEEVEEPKESSVEEISELTPEIIDKIYNEIGDESISKEVFAKGMEKEAEHLTSLKGDWGVIGKIVVDHLKESPNYYVYLEELEAKINDEKKASEEEVEEKPEPSEEEVEKPIQAEEEENKEVFSAEESKKEVEEGKIPEDPTKVDKEGKTQQTLQEDTLNYVPKGTYKLSDAEGNEAGKIELDTAIEGEVVKKKDGKKVIKLKKKSPEEEVQYIVVEESFKLEDKEVKETKDKE